MSTIESTMRCSTAAVSAVPNTVIRAGAAVAFRAFIRDISARKALEAKLPVILVVNKTDRHDARIGEVCFAPINGLRQSGLSGPNNATTGLECPPGKDVP